MSDKKPELYGIYTREQWLRDFGAGAENYVPPVLDPADVPESVRPLVTVAEIFGIRNDVTRGDFIDKLSDEALRAFCDTMERFKPAYDSFMDSLPKDVKQWSKTAKHFLYLSPAYAEAHGELYVCRKAPRHET
jgi:hypothetical protein